MTFRTLNEYATFPLFLVLLGILVTLLYPRTLPNSEACFGTRSQVNAQAGAVAWLHRHPPDAMWSLDAILNARVQCLPITQGARWSECRIGPVGDGDLFLVVDCDTSERNNIGCVSGR